MIQEETGEDTGTGCASGGSSTAANGGTDQPGSTPGSANSGADDQNAPLPLTIGLTTAAGGGGNSGNRGSWLYQTLMAYSPGHLLMNGVALVNSQIQSVTTSLVNSTNDPMKSAVIQFYSSELQNVLSFTAGAGAFGMDPNYATQVVSGVVNNAYNAYNEGNESAGGGLYGAFFGLSNATGVNRFVDGLFGLDTVTYEELNGDQQFDRFVEGIGNTANVIATVGGVTFALGELAGLRVAAAEAGALASEEAATLPSGLSPNMADDLAHGLTRAQREALVASRPERFRKGIVDNVWNNAKDANGRVFDPNTLEELKWDPLNNRNGQWDMGHVPGKSYNQLKQQFLDGEISRQQFLDEYNNPANYRPEAPSPNRSRRYQ